MHIKLITKFSESNNTKFVIKVTFMHNKAAIEEVFFKIKTNPQITTAIKNNLACKNNRSVYYITFVKKCQEK